MIKCKDMSDANDEPFGNHKSWHFWGSRAKSLNWPPISITELTSRVRLLWLSGTQYGVTWPTWIWRFIRLSREQLNIKRTSLRVNDLNNSVVARFFHGTTNSWSSTLFLWLAIITTLDWKSSGDFMSSIALFFVMQSSRIAPLHLLPHWLCRSKCPLKYEFYRVINVTFSYTACISLEIFF